MAAFLTVLLLLIAGTTFTEIAVAAELFTVDGEGTVTAAGASRASMQRTPPAAVEGDVTKAHGDPDALRYMIAARLSDMPSLVTLRSPHDQLRDVPLHVVPLCPSTIGRKGITCAVTPPIRVALDRIDARHPLVAKRSIVARLGDSIEVVGGKDVIGTVRVAGPRRTPAGPIERLSAKLRFVLVKLSPKGTLPVGGDDSGAREIARAALDRVNSLWGACGVSFGERDTLAVELVDPPPPHMLAVGCDHGLPASGGVLRFRAGSAALMVGVDKGMIPAEVARLVARALERRGFGAVVSDNPRMAAGAGATTDISVRDSAGKLVALRPPARGKMLDDKTLRVCIGGVNLEDGLQHFGDVDAMVGTVEERALIRAFDDHDPRTLDVMLVPGFARGGRIGESFIGADGGTIRNVVVIDRAGIRSNRASFTLAHEVGHVLLDDPGHPDDFGRDLPTRLMDADAADPTAFGPRRLIADECARAVRQSGPGAGVEMLEPQPF